MGSDPPEQQPAPACAKCGHGALRHVTSLPRRFDQRSGFMIFHCGSCGHLQWEPEPGGPPGRS